LAGSREGGGGGCVMALYQPNELSV